MVVPSRSECVMCLVPSVHMLLAPVVLLVSSQQRFLVAWGWPSPACCSRSDTRATERRGACSSADSIAHVQYHDMRKITHLDAAKVKRRSGRNTCPASFLHRSDLLTPLTRRRLFRCSPSSPPSHWKSEQARPPLLSLLLSYISSTYRAGHQLPEQ